MSSSTPERRDVRTAWEREYAEGHAYTTSYRDELDRGVQFLLGFLAAADLTIDGPILECACGRGRNALPLAAAGHRVVGLDHALTALACFRQRAQHEGLSRSTVAIRHDLRQPFPVASGRFGAVLDITAIDNLVRDEDRRSYGSEVARALRPGGLAIIVTFDVDDGYYGPFLEGSPWRAERVVEDPNTRIRNRLFRGAELDAVFVPALERVAANRFDFLDEAADVRWTRRFHLRLYRKPSG